ncbi:hypothetical protein Anapl_06260 [Anas platyrhynchos]|uniref:Uncharacterized protein n=1 Tax=Anas platyrhynchos TaxID=8839 RepID=R0LR88_ANAPL|nr:hypothetical protein Anapl_06260 [Anas platyrhynchos]
MTFPEEMDGKGSDQEGHLEEPCPEAESLEAGAVAAFTVEDQKSAVDGIPNEIIGNLEDDVIPAPATMCMVLLYTGVGRSCAQDPFERTTAIMWTNARWLVRMKTSETETPRPGRKTELKQNNFSQASVRTAVRSSVDPEGSVDYCSGPPGAVLHPCSSQAVSSVEDLGEHFGLRRASPDDFAVTFVWGPLGDAVGSGICCPCQMPIPDGHPGSP